ncbi:hypothetical protein FLGSB24_18850 [Flavobacterium sp. GSB-24]|nr:hypothetical protein FLGSB24_18850 [Flavobacterium sp. GSB-24]
MKMKTILSALLLLITALNVKGQERKQPPIPIELTLGNNRFGLQSVINKHLPHSEKLSFFSVSTFESNYTKNANNLDFINNSQLAYDLYKGFGIIAGLNVGKTTGLAPTAGVQYVFVSHKWLFAITPTYIFSDDRNISVLSLLEYKPQLSANLKLYSRIQGLYNQNIKRDTHERSYLQLRLGLEYKDYQMGLASNLDYYGRNRFFKENYGIFLRTNLY